MVSRTIIHPSAYGLKPNSSTINAYKNQVTNFSYPKKVAFNGSFVSVSIKAVDLATGHFQERDHSIGQIRKQTKFELLNAGPVL